MRNDPGARFHWLRTVDESYQRMQRSIVEAKSCVRLETYIYTATLVGEQFRDALTAAAARGIEVKVMIDAWGSMELPGNFWEPLDKTGGNLRSFNPLRLDRWSIRNHRKLLVCDDTVAYVGGFNIGSEFQGDGVAQGWYDLGIEVNGLLVQELAESFDRLFEIADFKPKRFARLRKAVSRHRLSTPDGELVLSGPGRGRNYLKRSIMNDLSRASRIRIVSAYFLPILAIRRALTRAARRGGQVQIILAGQSDVPLAQLAARCLYLTFLKAGVEIYEYQPQILHAKLLVLDDVVYVGSANLDRRSFYINYELALRLANPPLAAEGIAIFEQARAHCRRVELSAWRESLTFWQRLKQRWAFILLGRLDTYIAQQQLKYLR